MNDEETECIVMIGEIGGQLEADAARWVHDKAIQSQLLGLSLEKLLQKAELWVMQVRLLGGRGHCRSQKENYVRMWNSCCGLPS